MNIGIPLPCHPQPICSMWQETISSMPPITLGYWDIRGVGEPIRLLLHYKRVQFLDKRYNFHHDEWKRDKWNLGLEFPNLPYFIDGYVRLTQSTTILRYLADKYQLDGRTPKERLQVSLVEQQIIDMRWLVGRGCFFEDDIEKARANYSMDTYEQLQLIARSLGNREFLVGNGVTYVDFVFCEDFDFFRYFVPDVCKHFPTLKAHQRRVMGLPGIKEYLSSSAYKRWPIFAPIAKFGGGGLEPERG